MSVTTVIWILSIVAGVSVVLNILLWRMHSVTEGQYYDARYEFRQERDRNHRLQERHERDVQTNTEWRDKVDRLIGDPAYYRQEVDAAAARIERLYQANRRKRLEAEAKAEAERRFKLEQERQRAEHERRMKEDPAYAAEVRRAAEAKRAAESASYIFAGDGGGYSGDGGCSDGGGGDGGGGCGD